jgi:hypothetical protein
MIEKSRSDAEYRLSVVQAKIALTAGLLLAVSVTFAQPATAAQPTPFLEDSTIVGAGGTLTATMIPVEKSNGTFAYWDMTILLNADSKGNLSLASGYPKFQPSVPVIISNFQAGNYAGPATVANGKFLVTVTGPGVGPGGTTVWSLASSKGANSCTAPASATWYTGPIAGNPLATRLKKVKITSADYSYGVVGTGTNYSPCYSTTYYYLPFEQGALIGVSQTQATLTISSFTSGEIDYQTPIAQITYTLLP